jgi:hypothetical protein
MSMQIMILEIKKTAKFIIRQVLKPDFGRKKPDFFNLTNPKMGCLFEAVKFLK